MSLTNHTSSYTILFLFLSFFIIPISSYKPTQYLKQFKTNNSNSLSSLSSSSSIIPNAKVIPMKVYSSVVSNINCTPMICHGSCLDSNTCACMPGYVNVLSEEIEQMGNKYCSYKQKEQLTAFFLEFFFPFGAGHFYSNRIIFGLIKICTVSIPMLVIIATVCGMLCTDKCLNTGTSSIPPVLLFGLFTLTGFAWWLADAIIFGMNNYHDGNDIPLNPW